MALLLYFFFAIFYITSNGHTKPLLASYIHIIILCGSNRLSIKKLGLYKSCFSFEVRQHGQQQLYLQYKVC